MTEELVLALDSAIEDMAGGGSTDINVNSLAWETLASSTSCSKVNRGYLQPTRGGDINSHPVMYPVAETFQVAV